jgi:hypothetical protein
MPAGDFSCSTADHQVVDQPPIAITSSALPTGEIATEANLVGNRGLHIVLDRFVENVVAHRDDRPPELCQPQTS